MSLRGIAAAIAALAAMPVMLGAQSGAAAPPVPPMDVYTLKHFLPIGPPELFADKLRAFAEAGVQRVFIWPVADEVRQLERFWNEVRPLVAAR